MCLGALDEPDLPMKDWRADLSSFHFSAGVEVCLDDFHFFSSSMETGLAASGRVRSSLVQEACVASNPCPSSGSMEEMKCGSSILWARVSMGWRGWGRCAFLFFSDANVTCK